MPFSLLALRSEDGKEVMLSATQSVLGQGAYKIVKGSQQISINSDTTKYAKAALQKVKNREWSAEDQASAEIELEKEVDITKKLLSAGAKNVLDVRTIRYNKKVHLFSKKCSEGSLQSYLAESNLSQQQMLNVALEQAKTLQIMHDICHTCHLDFKLGNILLDRERDKANSLTTRLCDFGTAQVMGEGNTTGCIGTFFPPEMRIDLNTPIPVHSSIDMWAFGVVLHRLHHPDIDINPLAFDAQGTDMQINLLQSIRTTCSDSDDPIDQLIAQLLSDDPSIRPSAGTAVQIIQQVIELGTLQSRKDKLLAEYNKLSTQIKEQVPTVAQWFFHATDMQFIHSLSSASSFLELKKVLKENIYNIGLTQTLFGWLISTKLTELLTIQKKIFSEEVARIETAFGLDAYQ